MNEVRIIPNQFRFVSGSMLKLIAVITMLIDHIAAAFLKNSSIKLLTVGGYTLTLYNFMRSVGRLAFPIFCFLLVEGFLHTRNRKRYGISLVIFALVSEIPWNLMHSGELFYKNQNVFFVLLTGYLALCAINYFESKPLPQAIAVFGLLAVCAFGRIDYGIAGYCFILAMYAIRNNEFARDAIGICILPSKWVGGLAFIPIAFYNGKRGFIKNSVLKYSFYAFYPVHLFVIYLLKYVL